jgi:protein-S-isoprenylcysteine O-methyltransferase Ste14
MLWIYEYFFPVVWVAFLVYWRIKAAGVKTTQRVETGAAQIARALALLLVVIMLSTNRIPLPWLYRQLWPSSILSFWAGAAVTVAGLLFAVWARVHLASNWSSAVTIKQGHELITSGPYGLVRHPIYTGILTGFLGTAIAVAQVRGVVSVVVMFVVFWAKLRKEEEWMRSQFGETYTAYARRTSALVPYVL